MIETPIQYLGKNYGNEFFVKREDFIPFSFGGNKARKAELFFQKIDEGGYDSVVTYGSASSNHCRIIANQCCKRGIDCYIISPENNNEQTFNSWMTALFGAERIIVPLDQVHETIDKQIASLVAAGRKPYFIEGGGHGVIGTEAYVQCYNEIVKQEQAMDLFFDYIYFATGTGTTQAGLICGQLLHHDDTRKIIGISIARKNPRGRDIVIDSVRSYMGESIADSDIQARTIFIDDYTIGYNQYNTAILAIIDEAMKEYGLPLDPTYTGKAFYGMRECISKWDLHQKKILFIHTGGTPLFFDSLMKR